MSVREKLIATGPKKILTIDGGGIRGVLALEILVAIEDLLREQSQRDDLTLADTFDYISGTSTGAIIAAGLALGMPARTLLDFYVEEGAAMFARASLLRRFHYRFEDDNLVVRLKELVGADTRLGSDRLQTLLMMVMRNATTDSPWPVSNNPYAKYNDIDSEECNLNLPLWQLVRASTAAPMYFPPETIQVGRQSFIFVDGGISPYNNPSFLTFLMATTDRFWINRARLGGLAVTWPAATGTERLLLVSIGTGSAANANEGLLPDEINLVYNISAIPAALMFAAGSQQDMLCRVFGDCLAGIPLDREIDDLIGTEGPVNPKLFTYVRYSAELSREGLRALGCAHIEPSDVQRLEGVDAIPQMREVGRAVAKRKVRAAHFSRFPV
jgi:uncharacterized protein